MSGLYLHLCMFENRIAPLDTCIVTHVHWQSLVVSTRVHQSDQGSSYASRGCLVPLVNEITTSDQCILTNAMPRKPPLWVEPYCVYRMWHA